MNLKLIYSGIKSSILVFIFVITGCTRNVSENRPNILIIFVDDLTYRAVGYNNPFVQTPYLDDLAERGIIFQNHYSASPVCAASRASMMTGKFPQENGCVGLDTEVFKRTVREDKTYASLPRLFNEGGYETWFAGKSHQGPPKEYGFQKGEITDDPRDSSAFKLANDYIDSYEGDKPFFFWLAPRQPHVPLIPGEEWLAKYDTSGISIDPNFLVTPEMKSIFNQGLPGELFFRDSDYTHNWKNLPAGPPRSESVIKDFIKAYYATVSHLDQQIGDMISLLEEKQILENTIIIFLSDNGYFLGNHGLGNKITMHEESVRVPMFIYSENLANKGIESTELISSLDIIPTILELAKIEVPEDLSGESLLPLFENPDHTLHDYVVSECVGVGGKPGEGHRMVRTKEWKYILSGINEEALYDVRKDPFELNNLIGKDSEIDNRLRNFMIEWMDKSGDKHKRPELKK